MSGKHWSKEDDLVLLMEVIGVSPAKPRKATFEEVAGRLPGQRTPKAALRRWQKLNDQYKAAKLRSKASSSPESTPSKPKPTKAKSCGRKTKGKKVTFSETSTPFSTPSQSNDETMRTEESPMKPRRWSSREQSRKNYADIDMPESNGEEIDDEDEVGFEKVEIKTE